MKNTKDVDFFKKYYKILKIVFYAFITFRYIYLHITFYNKPSFYKKNNYLYMASTYIGIILLDFTDYLLNKNKNNEYLFFKMCMVYIIILFILSKFIYF